MINLQTVSRLTKPRLSILLKADRIPSRISLLHAGFSRNPHSLLTRRLKMNVRKMVIFLFGIVLVGYGFALAPQLHLALRPAGRWSRRLVGSFDLDRLDRGCVS